MTPVFSGASRLSLPILAQSQGGRSLSSSLAPGGLAGSSHDPKSHWATTFAAMNKPDSRSKATSAGASNRPATQDRPSRTTQDVGTTKDRKDATDARKDRDQPKTAAGSATKVDTPVHGLGPHAQYASQSVNNQQGQATGAQGDSDVPAAAGAGQAAQGGSAVPADGGASSSQTTLTSVGSAQADQASGDAQVTSQGETQAQTQTQAQEAQAAGAGQVDGGAATASAVANQGTTKPQGQANMSANASSQPNQPQALTNPENAQNANGQGNQNSQSQSDTGGHNAQSGGHHSLTQASQTTDSANGTATTAPAADHAGTASTTASPAGAPGAAVQVNHVAGPPAAHTGTLAHQGAHPGGAAAQSPAQALLNGQEAGDTDPNVTRIAQGLRSVVNLKGGALTIRMNPIDLGSVRIEMNIHNGVINAQLQTQHASVRDLLAHEIGQLRDTLQSKGLTVQRLEVQGPTTNNHAGANGQAQHSPDQGRSRGQFFQQNQSGGQGQGHSSDGQEKNQRDQFDMMLLDMVG